MSRRGPGHTPFPRHGVLRVNDLVGPEVDPAEVLAALAARGVPVGSRDVPLRTGVRALVAVTAAGTVVTLERRSGGLTPRAVVLRRLGRLWDLLARDLDRPARSPVEPGGNRTIRGSAGS